MSNPHDPYDVPPAPDRFEPPRGDGPDRVEPIAPEAYPATVQVTDAEPYARGIEPEGGSLPPTGFAPADQAHLGADPRALEPLPAMAGNFGTTASNPAIESGSLSSRLADEFVAWLKTLASAAVYATLIVTFGFQVARVEGQSMAPTLQNQDRLIVNKFAYLSAIGVPKVGDIVMLYYPNNPDKSFVKRVIAAEGQRVLIVNGKVKVDDVPVDDSFVPEQYRSHDDWGPETVPEGYYFVMGDHRNNSSDSRHWGFVPKRYIIGRVQLRWWPVPDARTF
jgi:signal peptidase I